MKNVEATLGEHLSKTKNFVSCDLYELQLISGNNYYYNNTDIDITHDGKTYLHHKLIIDRKQTKINDRVVVDSMTVTIKANSTATVDDKPILLAAHDGVLDRAKFYLRRCFFTGTTVIGVIDLFSGNVEVKKCGGIGLELTVKAKTQGLAQEFPIRRYYPQGTYSTTDGKVVSDDKTTESCLIAPFVPQKEVLL